MFTYSALPKFHRSPLRSAAVSAAVPARRCEGEDAPSASSGQALATAGRMPALQVP